MFLEKKVAAQEQEAREKARAKDKRGAMMALKRKKMLEAEMEQLGQARLALRCSLTLKWSGTGRPGF